MAAQSRRTNTLSESPPELSSQSRGSVGPKNSTGTSAAFEATLSAFDAPLVHFTFAFCQNDEQIEYTAAIFFRKSVAHLRDNFRANSTRVAQRDCQ